MVLVSAHEVTRSTGAFLTGRRPHATLARGSRIFQIVQSRHLLRQRRVYRTDVVGRAYALRHRVSSIVGLTFASSSPIQRRGSMRPS